jgi:hypothetical protein
MFIFIGKKPMTAKFLNTKYEYNPFTAHELARNTSIGPSIHPSIPTYRRTDNTSNTTVSHSEGLKTQIFQNPGVNSDNVTTYSHIHYVYRIQGCWKRANFSKSRNQSCHRHNVLIIRMYMKADPSGSAV